MRTFARPHKSSKVMNFISMKNLRCVNAWITRVVCSISIAMKIGSIYWLTLLDSLSFWVLCQHGHGFLSVKELLLLHVDRMVEQSVHVSGSLYHGEGGQSVCRIHPPVLVPALKETTTSFTVSSENMNKTLRPTEYTVYWISIRSLGWYPLG